MTPPGGFRRSLQGLLIQMAPPYGFTLATFTVIGITTYYKGAAHPLQILLFLAGAFLGYALVGLVSISLHRMLIPVGITMRGWQMLHVVPLAIVFLLAWVSGAWVSSPMCWLTSGFALTVGYTVGLAAMLHFVTNPDDVMEFPNAG